MNEEIDIEEFAPWLLIIIILVGGFLRVLLLGTKGMWLDETFSVWMASHSIADMLQWTVRIDQHPPLYYFLLHYWIALNGDTPYYARLLSALFGAGTIPIMYLIGKRISGAVVGLLAAVFMALSLFNISFAQETRMYTLLTFNAAVAIYALVRLLTDPRSDRPIGSQVREAWQTRRTPRQVEPEIQETFSYKTRIHSRPGWRVWVSRRFSIRSIETDLAWIALILFSAATMLSHNTAILFPLAVNVYVLGLMLYQKIKKSGPAPAFQAPSFGNWVKAQAAIFLLWSPWIPSFIKQASAVDQRFWIPAPTWDAVVQTLKTFLNPSAPLPESMSRVIWVLYGLVIVLGLLYFRKRVSQLLFLVALFAVPFLGELIVSIRRPIFYDRTLIWTTIPLYLVLAAGVAQLKFRPLIILGLVSLATINLFSAADYYRFYQKEDWATPAGYVANFAEKGDLVLFNSNFVEVSFNYYFRTYEDLYAIQVEKQGLPLDLFDSGILEPEMTSNDIPRLISMLREHDRVWLVYSHDSYTDPAGLIPETLGSRMKITRMREFYGGKVQLYETP